jgi:hypothetical protein
LLRLIAGAGGADHAELARALGVTPSLIQEMLDTLSRQGYLKRVVAKPPATCGQCPLRRECPSAGKPRLWILSEKGARVLARHQT